MKITKDTNVNLKDTLKQYDNYLSSIVFKINKLSSRYKKHTVRKFRKFDLGNPELIVISLLGQTDINEKITIKDLSAQHWMDKTYISRACIKLIKLGILSKIDSRKDRRSHSLSLTKKGIKIYSLYRESKKIRYLKIMNNFTENETKTLHKLLDKLTLNTEIQLIK
tara:strand:+ start:55 stop:552 length:498 start_codon:yes stop_codon:yes gene_type:complete